MVLRFPTIRARNPRIIELESFKLRTELFRIPEGLGAQSTIFVRLLELSLAEIFVFNF